MPTIFISYATEDLSTVKELDKYLKDHGFQTWLDRNNILPGENWRESIQRGLEETDFIIVCISKNSVNKRGFVQREMKFALDMLDELLDNDIFLIPLKLDDTLLPQSLKKVQCTDFYTSNGRKKLLKSLLVGAERRNLELPLKEPITTTSSPKEKIDLSNLGGGKLAKMLGFLK